MMATDVRLEANTVVVEAGKRLEVMARDIGLDGGATSRDGGNDGEPLRRALRHAEGDRLVINWTGDYGGGTWLDGGKVLVALPAGHRLIATDASPAGAPNFLPNESPDLIRDGPAGADGTVYAVDLIGQINQLRAEIAVLKTLVVHVVLPKLK